MSISEPVFFLIDPYSAFHALFAANLVSHNSVFLQRPKTERPRWTECHAAMFRSPRAFVGVTAALRYEPFTSGVYSPEPLPRIP